MYCWFLQKSIDMLLVNVLKVLHADGHGPIDLSKSNAGASPPPSCTDVILRPKYDLLFPSLVLNSGSSDSLQQVKRPGFLAPPASFNFDLVLKIISSMAAHIDLGLAPVVPSFKHQKLILSPLSAAPLFKQNPAAIALLTLDTGSGFLEPCTKRLMEATVLNTGTISEAPMATISSRSLVLYSKSSDSLQQVKRPGFVGAPGFYNFDLLSKIISSVAANINLGLAPMVPPFKRQKLTASPLSVTPPFKNFSLVTALLTLDKGSGLQKQHINRLMKATVLATKSIAKAPLATSFLGDPSTSVSIIEVDPKVGATQQEQKKQTKKRGEKKCRTKKATKKWEKAIDRQKRSANLVNEK
ncbi:hypothetical protein MMC07_006227 [Pseudocyphellaria aurata]|nr:hypothetical protein [Pseudocyphellaria aurata]